MGYRSDVTIALYPRSDLREELWPAINLWVQENWPDASETAITYDDTSYIAVIRYHGWKWYRPHYSDVQAVHTALELFGATFNGLPPNDEERAHWEFVRIGEDDTDIEREGSDEHDYRLCVERKVVVG
jgi:hypothetical protein